VGCGAIAQPVALDIAGDAVRLRKLASQFSGVEVTSPPARPWPSPRASAILDQRAVRLLRVAELELCALADRATTTPSSVLT
jgi:hypothetical protein